MAVKHKKQHRHTRPKRAKKLTPKALTAAAAVEYGVPFWLLWGIAGAESTWGRGGTNLFGLLDAAEGANISDWRSSSRQAAKTLAGLKRQYGTWSAAVEHYSGNSYTISHPKELAGQEGVTPANSNAVAGRQLTGLGEDLLPGTAGKVAENLLNPLHLQPFGGDGNKPGHLDGPQLNPFVDPSEKSGSGLFAFPEELIQAGSAITAFLSMLTDINFWIRVGLAVGAFILIYMGLHSLTGQGPGVSSGTQLATAVATKGAA